MLVLLLLWTRYVHILLYFVVLDIFRRCHTRTYTVVVLVNFEHPFLLSSQACGRFINNNAVTKMVQSSSKSPELLARYCDSLLKKRCVTQSLLWCIHPTHNSRPTVWYSSLRTLEGSSLHSSIAIDVCSEMVHIDIDFKWNSLFRTAQRTQRRQSWKTH